MPDRARADAPVETDVGEPEHVADALLDGGLDGCAPYGENPRKIALFQQAFVIEGRECDRPERSVGCDEIDVAIDQGRIGRRLEHAMILSDCVAFEDDARQREDEKLRFGGVLEEEVAEVGRIEFEAAAERGNHPGRPARVALRFEAIRRGLERIAVEQDDAGRRVASRRRLGLEQRALHLVEGERERLRHQLVV